MSYGDCIPPPTRREVYEQIKSIQETTSYLEETWMQEVSQLEHKDIGFDHYVLNGTDDDDDDGGGGGVDCSVALEYFPYYSGFLPLAKSLLSTTTDHHLYGEEGGEGGDEKRMVEAVGGVDMYVLDCSSNSSACSCNALALSGLGLWRNHVRKASIDTRSQEGVLVPECYIYDACDVESCISRAMEEMSRQIEMVKVVLHKLLRHSLSDIQHDIRLAAEILHKSGQLKLFDDVSYLRNTLIILRSEFPTYAPACNGNCFQNAMEVDEDLPPHSCLWTKILIEQIQYMVCSITSLSHDHMLLLCSWFQLEYDYSSPSGSEWDAINYDRVVSSMLDSEESHEQKKGVMGAKKFSAMVKQSIFIGHAESDRDVFTSPSLVLLRGIAKGIHHRVAEKNFFLKERDIYDSEFANHIKLSTFISECTLRRLPDNDLAVDIGSEIFSAIVKLFISEKDFQTNKGPTHPEKYSRYVTEASTFYCSIKFKIPEDTRNAVRGLYLRDLAFVVDKDSDVKRLYGYGDWLINTGQPLSPHDVLLLTHAYNYFFDENEFSTDGALYDFILMNFFRAWKLPWSPNRHKSFQPTFRAAVKSLYLSSYYYQIPFHLTEIISSYLNRNWWEDERRTCFSKQCSTSSCSTVIQRRIILRELNGAGKSLSDIVSHRVPPLFRQKQAKCLFCEGCNLVLFCNRRECQRNAVVEGHRKKCKYPPYRLGSEEMNVCAQIITGKNACKDILQDCDIDFDVNDESSWESVDSDESSFVEPINPQSQYDISNFHNVEMLYRFFESRSFRHQQNEPLPFAGFYDSDESSE